MVSASKRSHQINIHYFLIKDVGLESRLSIEHILTEDIVSGFVMTPLHGSGSKFKGFRNSVVDSYTLLVPVDRSGRESIFVEC